MQILTIPKSPRYREAAYQAIKDAILNGHFAPGEPLIEEQIASTLKISRTPVREALALLEHEELIAPRGGRGLYVRQLSREEFIAMFVANEAVEPYLARQAALRATDEQQREMLAAVERGVEAAETNSTPGALRSGRDFHRLVGEAAGNQPLAQFVARNEERTDLYLISYGKMVSVAAMEASNKEHRAILNAISARDPEGAARLTIYHSQSFRHRFEEYFSGGNKPDVE